MEQLLDESVVTQRGGAPAFSSRWPVVGSEMEPENGRWDLKVDSDQFSRVLGKGLKEDPRGGGCEQTGAPRGSKWAVRQLHIPGSITAWVRWGESVLTS